MIKVLLSNGKTIEVPKGKVGEFKHQTKNTMVDTLIETTLDIKADTSYNSPILASFIAGEVVGWTMEDEEEESA